MWSLLECLCPHFTELLLMNNKHGGLVGALQLQQLHPPEPLCLFYGPVILRADPGDASFSKSQIQEEQCE